MIHPVQESACHYLFGMEAGKIYDTSLFSEEFVNQSLTILMRINQAFLSRKENDGFSIIDPAAGNNQCHIYAWISLAIKRKYKSLSEEEKLAYNQENRFLHLSFLLSWTFLKDSQLRCQTIERALEKEKIVPPSPSKQFYLFIKGNQRLMGQIRQSLNQVFERYIKDSFQASKERSLLHKELYLLSCEDLKHVQSYDGDKHLYTLPKLAGIAFFINENIPFIIKTKVVTPNGNGKLYYQSGPVKDEPVVVFEGIASEDLSIDQFESMAQHCPSYFFRNVSRKNRHSKKESCLFCNQKQTNIERYQERFKIATKAIQDTLYALGADFMRENQPSFVSFFQNEAKYPILTKIFQKAVASIDGLGLSMKKPLAFTVQHVYLDDAQHALNPQLRMDSSPQSFLEQRGYL